MDDSELQTFYAGRPVLVTGGAGFIGSHLTEQLLRMGARVRVLARYNSAGSVGFLEPIESDSLDVRLGDVTDGDYVARTMEGIDTVFHLAALIGIPYSYVAPGHYVATNIVGTMAVLEAARRFGTRRVVHTSTSETFGSAQYVPMDELHPIVAQSPYAATKIAADQLAGSYFRSFGTPVVTLRPFNTFGPRQSMRAVIPTIVHQLLAGDEVRIGSVTPIRDLNPVPNTVSGFVRAGAASGVDGELFVVGSGVGHSVADVIDEVGRQLGRSPKVVTEVGRMRPASSEVSRLVCDYTKAASALGYAPTISFEQGIAASIEYCRAEPTRRLGYAV